MNLASSTRSIEPLPLQVPSLQPRKRRATSYGGANMQSAADSDPDHPRDPRLEPDQHMHVYMSAYEAVGPPLLVLITFVGVRLLSYWRSFVFHSDRYRHTDTVSTQDLHMLSLPYLKVQITTRGSAGSTEVVLRGIRNVQELGAEDPTFYRELLSVELITESKAQAARVERTFAGHPIAVDAVVLPDGYETPNGTKLKARALHFAVERRRAGWNRKPGRTFILHYDEESVMVPGELRKLLRALATNPHRILEGPIHYPLEYMNTSPLCRAMEANRPIGCFECRHVMESGIPLHLHGSNLVLDEDFENDLGWDIGCLDDEPFIAEDYVFGMSAFLSGGTDVFDWHGCVMLEQPPLSYRSAFRQRYRWIFGVLQGLTMTRRSPGFATLPRLVRLRLVLGTLYRIATFALGAVIGIFALGFGPLYLLLAGQSLLDGHHFYLSTWITLWLTIVGGLWLGSIFIGGWYNVAEAGLAPLQRIGQLALVVCLAPIAGIFESCAGLWALLAWCGGRRTVEWQPTPKTAVADANIPGRTRPSQRDRLPELSDLTH
ncbi:MAG: glycosyltransferase family 2 protein [Acidimicrobiales bacterium]